MNMMQMMSQLSRNPQMLQSMLNNNPLFQRAMQMSQGKSEDEIKVIIRNLADQRGISVDQLNLLLTPIGMKL